MCDDVAWFHVDSGLCFFHISFFILCFFRSPYSPLRGQNTIIFLKKFSQKKEPRFVEIISFRCVRSVFWLSVENSDSIMVTWRSTCHACIYRCWSQYQKNRTHFTEPKMNRSSRTKCGMPLNKYFIFFANKFKMCSPNWDHYWASVQKIRRLVQKGIKPNRKKFWWLVVSWAKKKT